ncbi:MAG: ACP S-malonyltransferase [Anaerolineae bacterium]
MVKTALVFTGQGSQYVGMGRDLAQAFPKAQALYDQAERIFPGLGQISSTGPEEVLNDTSNTQPAIYTFEIALWQLFRERWSEQIGQVACLAGHSLGEYAALTAAGSFDFTRGLPLVIARGRAMCDAGAQSPGGMTVVMGLEDAVVAEVIEQVRAAGGAVWVANQNAPGQVVIAGTREGLDQAKSMAIAKGAKRVVPLAVSVACHTPLLDEACQTLTCALQQTRIDAPWAPVICNVDALPVCEPDGIRSALLRQLTSPVRWVESVRYMQSQGITNFIELGPKPVLAGLIQRIYRALTVQSVTDLTSLENLRWEA